MAHILNAQLDGNSLRFKTSLDRIIEKYSTIRHEDEGMKVDLNNVKIRTIAKHISNSHGILNMMESKRLADLNEETLSGQNATGNSQLDFTCTDGDRTCNSTSTYAVEDNEMMLNTLDESSRNLSEEEQDEELQMSLSSHGSSLLELYPSMVSRIKKACCRQHVTDAASSVLRRYQRWRQQSRRGSTFNVSLRHTNENTKIMSISMVRLKESSPVRRLETSPPRVLQTVTSLHDGQAQKPSPAKEAPSITHPVFESTQPREISLNKTFNVSEMSPCKHVSKDTASFSQPYGTFGSSKATFLNLPKLSVPSHSAESSTYSRESPAGTKRHGVYDSPVRQSPFKPRTMNTFTRSPQAFSKGLPEYFLDHCSRKSARPRSLSVSLPSSPKRHVVQQKMLSPPSSQPQPAPRADGHHRLRRHLSFDSSPKKVDEEFVKLYHKLVCQNKFVFSNSLSCRLCARSSEVNRDHSSSSLAALALSPHRSVLCKRHRVTESDSYPQSKRHKSEMVRRCLSPSELELPHGAFTFSPSKPRTQRAAAHQDSWVGWHRRVPAADLSFLGD